MVAGCGLAQSFMAGYGTKILRWKSPPRPHPLILGKIRRNHRRQKSRQGKQNKNRGEEDRGLTVGPSENQATHKEALLLAKMRMFDILFC